MKKRTEVIIEIEREITISISNADRFWCIECGKQVQMLTARDAAQMINSDESIVYNLADSGKLHVAATNSGALRICPDSLLSLMSDKDSRSSQRLLVGEAHKAIRTSFK